MNETSTSNNIFRGLNSYLGSSNGAGQPTCLGVVGIRPLFGSGVARHIPKLGSIWCRIGRPTPAECLRLHP